MVRKFCIMSDADYYVYVAQPLEAPKVYKVIASLPNVSSLDTHNNQSVVSVPCFAEVIVN